MMLIDVLRPWLKEKWILSISLNAEGVHIVTSVSSWVAKIFDDHVEVRNSDSYAVCICCSSRKTLKVADPDFFHQLEAAINEAIK